MSGRLTAENIRLILIDLECAEKYREAPGVHADCIKSVRDTLLRAALVDVEVETEEKAMSEEPAHGWLIELRPSVSGRPAWWAPSPSGDLDWSHDPMEAIRHARKIDAERVIACHGWTEAFARPASDDDPGIVVTLTREHFINGLRFGPGRWRITRPRRERTMSGSERGIVEDDRARRLHALTALRVDIRGSGRRARCTASAPRGGGGKGHPVPDAEDDVDRRARPARWRPWGRRRCG